MRCWIRLEMTGCGQHAQPLDYTDAPTLHIALGKIYRTGIAAPMQLTVYILLVAENKMNWAVNKYR